MTEHVAVGRIARAHGVRGEVAVQILSEIPERFAPGAVLHLEDGTTLTVEASRPHGQRLLVRFREVPDRNRADELRGQVLIIAASEVPDAPQGSYWPHQIEGCEVVTEEGRSLGRVAEVMRAPANDVWSVRDDGGEVLIPALADVVVSVDVETRRIVVRETPGITND